MSIITCAVCETYVDTDNDPAFFVEVDQKNGLEQVEICERCRERLGIDEDA